MSWDLDADETSLDFAVRRLGVTTLRGRFDRFAVAIRRDWTSPVGWAFDLRIATAGIATGDPARDAQLAGGSSLQAERYPEIVFRTRRAEPLHDLENSLTRVSGDLTVRGTTRPVNWEFELLARAQDDAEELGAQYVGHLEFEPWKWGIGSALPLIRQTATITLRLLVLATDRGQESRGEEIAPDEVFAGATKQRRIT